MNRSRFTLAFQTLSIVVLLSGCSTLSPHIDSPGANRSSSSLLSSEDVQRLAQNSSVEIQYVLGRSHYRFFIEAHGDLVTANSELDREVLEKGEVNSKHYPAFLIKANNFIVERQQATSDTAPCRNPFIVTVKIGTELKSARGCRSHEGGAISKLVRDGEFLLYSKN
jgi:hypothetical protein